MKFILIFSVSLLLLASSVYAQELYNDVQHIWRAQVVAVISETEELVEGTETKNKVQVLKVALKEGERAGESVTFRNDYIQLKKGDNFFLSHIITMDGDEYYAVRDIDRRYVLTGLFFLFIMAVVIFARGQGIRSLLSLVGSLLVIIYILLPGVLAGF